MNWELLLALLSLYLIGVPLLLATWLWRQQRQLTQLQQRLNDALGSPDALASRSNRPDSLASMASAASSNADTSAPTLYEPSPKPPQTPSPDQELRFDPALLAQLSPIGSSSMASPSTDAPPPWVNWLMMQLANGRWLAALGLGLSLLGVILLLRLAVDYGWLPMELRLGMVAASAMLGLALAQRLSTQRPLLALPLQGLCLTLLLLCIYAGGQWLALYPSSLALGLLSAVIVLACLLAIQHRSQSLAFVALIGGFASPVLASNGQGDVWLLFSYYGLLNLGVLLLAWFFRWRWVSQTAMGLSILAAYGFAATGYNASDWLWAQSLLLMFWALYLGLAWLWLTRHPGQQPFLLSILLAPALAGFGLQYGLLPNTGWLTSAVALGYGFVYAGLSALALRQGLHRQQPAAVELLLVLGLIFASLSVPLALAPELGITLWLIEAGIISFFGRRQRLLSLQLLGLTLAWLALLWWLINDPAQPFALWLLSTVVLAWLASRRLPGPWPKGWRPVWQPGWLRAEALALSLFSLLLLHGNTAGQSEPWSNALVTFLVLVLFTLWHWHAKPSSLRAWLLLPWLAWQVGWLWPSLIPASLFSSLASVWPNALAIALSLASLPLLASKLLRLNQAHLHALINLTLVLLVAALWQLHHLGAGTTLSWPLIVLSTLITLALACRWWQRPLQPLLAHPLGNLLVMCVASLVVVLLGSALGLPLGGCLAIALLLSAMLQATDDGRSHAQLWSVLLLSMLALNLFSSGQLPSIGYWPLLNPLDLASLALLYLSRPAVWPQRHGPLLWTVCVWLWLTLLLGRSMGQWLLADSQVSSWWPLAWAQLSLSLFWAGSALALMLLGRRQQRINLWWSGTALLALTVVKLLIFDLGNSDTLARILSFIGVGILIWLAAWLAPLTPDNQENSNASP